MMGLGVGYKGNFWDSLFLKEILLAIIISKDKILKDGF